MKTTPCQARPEDWYIERDGKQYDDVQLITLGDFIPTYDHLKGFSEPPSDEEIEEWEDEAVRRALIRRRQARDACFVDCLTEVRLRCLDMALSNNETHGTWGGYYPEQRRAIVKAQQERLDREVPAEV